MAHALAADRLTSLACTVRLFESGRVSTSWRRWVDQALQGALPMRRAVDGSTCGWQSAFVEKVKEKLGPKALHRELDRVDGTMRYENLARLTAAILPSK